MRVARDQSKQKILGIFPSVRTIAIISPPLRAPRAACLAEGEQEDRYFGVLGFKSALLSTASYCLLHACAAQSENAMEAHNFASTRI
jgi:hypothetical protein